MTNDVLQEVLEEAIDFEYKLLYKYGYSFAANNSEYTRDAFVELKNAISKISKFIQHEMDEEANNLLSNKVIDSLLRDMDRNMNKVYSFMYVSNSDDNLSGAFRKELIRRVNYNVVMPIEGFVDKAIRGIFDEAVNRDLDSVENEIQQFLARCKSDLNKTGMSDMVENLENFAAVIRGQVNLRRDLIAGDMSGKSLNEVRKAYEEYKMLSNMSLALDSDLSFVQSALFEKCEDVFLVADRFESLQGKSREGNSR